MENASEEFLEHTEGRVVKCAVIGRKYTHFTYKLGDYDADSDEDYKLPILLEYNYTQEELNKFLNEIDFEYDGGFGEQELYGFIWYTDGSWSERGEYDGSEWWGYKKCPSIEDFLCRKDK